MPEKTRVPCKQPGCRELVRPPMSRCEQHQRNYDLNKSRRYNEQRNSDPLENELNKFYKSRAWRELRKWFIQNNPVCIQCGHIGTVVDHIVPRRSGGASFDVSNLQTMCDTCHNSKRQSERLSR